MFRNTYFNHFPLVQNYFHEIGNNKEIRGCTLQIIENKAIE